MIIFMYMQESILQAIIYIILHFNMCVCTCL